MSSVAILTGISSSSHTAKEKLLTKISNYDSGWHIQGGISHAIKPSENEESTPIHYFSVLIVQD